MADYTNYTYDDFLRAAQEAGLYGNFSQYDLNLAQQNPGAGMQILQAKQNWANAATEQDRLAANAAAEQIRSQYGSYLGGADGSEYNPFGSTQTSFGSTAGTNGGYGGSPYDADIQNLYAQQLGYQPYQDNSVRPTYNNRYDADINAQLYGLVNTPVFSYDASQDPLYSQYRKQYIREGKRAAEDTMGNAAAMSGGIPSSYAVTAAGQAQNYYNSQLTDKIPELYQIAYNKYLNDFQMQQSKLAALQGAEQFDYQKYLDELGQYNTDRNFGYNQYMDQYNLLANNLQTAQGLEGTAYQRYLDDLNDQYTKAQMAASAGDLSYLQALGIDTSNWWTLNGPKASGGGGSGYSGGGNGGDEAEEGLIEHMLSLGNDVAAREYLRKYLGSSTQADRDWYWEQYLAAKDAATPKPVKPTADPTQFSEKQLQRIEDATKNLLQINDPNSRYDKLLWYYSQPGYTEQMTKIIYGAVNNWGGDRL